MPAVLNSSVNYYIPITLRRVPTLSQPKPNSLCLNNAMLKTVWKIDDHQLPWHMFKHKQRRNTARMGSNRASIKSKQPKWTWTSIQSITVNTQTPLVHNYNSFSVRHNIHPIQLRNSFDSQKNNTTQFMYIVYVSYLLIFFIEKRLVLMRKVSLHTDPTKGLPSIQQDRHTEEVASPSILRKSSCFFLFIDFGDIPWHPPFYVGYGTRNTQNW